ncbi:MAG: 3-phosphoserine/phosphohydroxythreonine transaminase, partial [Chloroflexi bacterium]|nr:3-phosphoserine/phosphohydroxythreonine transaminase [Chloroflexota bacterium]
MSDRVFNFNPGPAVLPLPVLEQAQKELLNYQGTGMSVMEISHRSKQFEEIVLSAEALLKELLDIPANYRVLFIGMGATGQFDMVPLNFLTEGKTADYLITGSFAKKAYKEALKVGNANVAGSTEPLNFTRILYPDEIKLSENPAYVHLTSNNTIYGTQWREFPDCGDIPLVADMSSDILSRRIDVSKFALIYAGAQKNLGPAGAAVVIIRDDMIEKSNPKLPAMLRYDTYANNNSLYNTPPTFVVYMIKLVLEWVKREGGLAVIEERNQKKAAVIYEAIDQSGGFYRGHAERESRSLMNITFRLPSEELENAFIATTARRKLAGLKGHREV